MEKRQLIFSSFPQYSNRKLLFRVYNLYHVHFKPAKTIQFCDWHYLKYTVTHTGEREIEKTLELISQKINVHVGINYMLLRMPHRQNTNNRISTHYCWAQKNKAFWKWKTNPPPPPLPSSSQKQRQQINCERMAGRTEANISKYPRIRIRLRTK